MTVRTRTAPKAPPPTERGDTRQRLLETAGEVFAEKGPASATGQEICERAGVNGAAISYYFGGMDRLYEAVLVEARGRAPSLDEVRTIVATQPDAEGRLRAVLHLAARAITGPLARTWAMRVLVRELSAPTPAFERLFLKGEVPEKMAFLKAMVGDLTDLPADHPAVARACVSLMAPFQVLMIADHSLWKHGRLTLDLTPAGADALADHFTDFALAGLAAIRVRQGKAASRGSLGAGRKRRTAGPEAGPIS